MSDVDKVRREAAAKAREDAADAQAQQSAQAAEHATQAREDAEAAQADQARQAAERDVAAQAAVDAAAEEEKAARKQAKADGA